MSEPDVNEKLIEMLPQALTVIRDVTALIARERVRTGMTTEQIFERAGVTLRETEAQLLNDLSYLQL